MGNRLRWYFDLIDRISGPAGKATKALEKLRTGLNGVQSAVGRASKAGGSLGGIFSGIGAKIKGALGMKEGGDGLLAGLSRAAIVLRAMLDTVVAIGGAVGAVAGHAADFAVSQATFHEGAMTSLRATLHNDPRGANVAARAEFMRSMQLAQMLPGDTNDFISSRRQLATVFTDARERDVIFAMQEDLANLNPERAGEVRTALTTVFAQIKGQDRILGNDLLQLGTAGLQRTELFDAIARSRNLQGTERQKRTRARELISNGSVHADEVFRALADATQRRTGQRLGGFAMQQGNSIGGLMSNISSAPATLMQTLFMERGGPQAMPGFQAFAGILRELNTLLSPASASGQRFMAVMERLINGVMAALFRGGDSGTVIETLLGLLEGAVPMVIALANGFRSFLVPMLGAMVAGMAPLLSLFAATDDAGNSWFQGFIANTGRLVGALFVVIAWVASFFAIGVVMVSEFFVEVFRIIGWVVDAIVWVVRALGQAFGWIGSAIGSAIETIASVFAGATPGATEAGRQTAQGFANGIRAGRGAISDAAAGAAGAAVVSTQTALDIHSPSRVMQRLGTYTAQGLADGIASGAGAVANAADGLTRGIGAPGPTAGALGALAGQQSGGAGPTIGQVNVTVEVPGGVTDPNGVADAVSVMLPRALMEALRALAIEGGSRDG